MSNLRWILLFAGLAILILLYFSGRPRKPRSNTDQQLPDPYNFDQEADSFDAGAPQQTTALTLDPHSQQPAMAPAQRDVLMESPQQYAQPPVGGSTDHAYPASPVDATYDHYGRPDENAVHSAQSDVSVADDFGPLDPTDLERPAGHGAQVASSDSQPGTATRNVVSLGERIEALGARFVNRRKERDRNRAAPASVTSIESEKIVSLHVVAPDGQYIDGQLLHDTFVTRGYQHGPMDIYHSMHNENAVFSIARMVVPGTFDVNNPASYQTPGITLFMQLPGPVPGDIAFDVLVSEAHELATALGCRILDNERSTLTRQTVQHLKDSISEFIHRQKFLNRVPG